MEGSRNFKIEFFVSAWANGAGTCSWNATTW